MTSAYSVRPSVNSLGVREGNHKWQLVVIAEVKFFISSTSLVSMLNHTAARAFRGKKNESFFPLNFNVYINLDNREIARSEK